ncbi:MAG: hypothetical protein ACREBB_06875 [Nitrosotalea sp.]
MNDRIRQALKKLGYDTSSFAAYSRSVSIDTEEIPANRIDWTLKFRRLKGLAFSFADRPYLTKIYLDQSPEINIVKPRQMEITELGLNWLLHNLSLHKYSVGLYMTDRFSHVEIFSNLRLRQGAIETSPKLKKLVVSEKGNVSWLPFGNGSNLYMYSAWGNFEAARSIPADFVVVDEMQSVNVEALPVLKETMSKSKFKKILKIGTGSHEGDDWYKEWHRGTLYEWKKSQADPITDIEEFDWINDTDTKVDGINSYHLSQSMAPWITQVDITYKQHSYTPRRFANEVEGWWYRGMRKPLLETDIRALMDSTLDFAGGLDVNHERGPVYMGFDWEEVNKPTQYAGYGNY